MLLFAGCREEKEGRFVAGVRLNILVGTGSQKTMAGLLVAEQ